MAEAAVLAYRQWRLERRMFWRNPTAAFFSFILPLLFLFLFGAIFSGDQKTLNVIVPGILGMSVMSTTFNALAMNITFLREEGVLKRIHGTPMPPISYLGGVTANAVSNATVQIVIVVLAGKLFFGIGWPKDWLELVRLLRRRRLHPGGAGRRLLARHPELRRRPGLHEHRLPAGHLHLRRLLRRRQRPAVPARRRPGPPAHPHHRRRLGGDGHRRAAGRQPGRPGGRRGVGRSSARSSRCAGSAGRRSATSVRPARGSARRNTASLRGRGAGGVRDARGRPRSGACCEMHACDALGSTRARGVGGRTT